MADTAKPKRRVVLNGKSYASKAPCWLHGLCIRRFYSLSKRARNNAVDAPIKQYLRRTVYPKLNSVAVRFDRAVLRVSEGAAWFGGYVLTKHGFASVLIPLCVLFLAAMWTAYTTAIILLALIAGFIHLCVRYVGLVSARKQARDPRSWRIVQSEQSFIIYLAVIMTCILIAALFQFFSWIALSA